MSFIQYKKYLEKAKDLDKDLPTRKRFPIVLSDSKGNYVKPYVKSIGRDIRWWNVRGLTTEAAVDWVIGKNDSKIRKHGPLCIYVWLGTCDLTTKSSRVVSLNRNFKKDCDETMARYERLSAYCSSREADIVLLEVPYFSITEYNRYLGHKNPESFQDQDEDLI